ncbi:MAG TPA: YgjV family protein [Limnobacter sp.]|nr:YgjV family protein [Limnobacter sp.]
MNLILDDPSTWVRFVGILAFLLNMLGFLIIHPQKTKLTVAAGSFAWALQYWLLQATTGMWILLLAGVRQTISAYTDGLPKVARLYLAFFFCAVALLLAGLTWSGWLSSAMPLAATWIGTWAFFMMSNKALRQTTLVSNAMWATYGYWSGSYELCLTMIVLSLATLTGLFRLRVHRV